MFNLNFEREIFKGLRDFEEIVVFRSLACLADLSSRGLLQKPTVYELVNDSVPFLCHPVPQMILYLLGISKLNMQFDCRMSGYGLRPLPSFVVSPIK